MKFNLKRFLSSVFTIGVIAIVAVMVSNAFFSDSETSTGNEFVAGDIDLKIDNTSYALDCNIPGLQENCSGELVASAQTSWQLKDLTIERFFNFRDLKPGDYGEDTISIHVGSNDAWLCAAAQITEDADNSITDPEEEDGDNGSDEDGELDENLNFAFWVDDGDNVLETDEVDSIFLQGPLSNIGQGGQIALADSSTSILNPNESEPNPIPGGTEFFIGKAWCFGELVASGNTAKDPSEQGTPLTRGTGVNCNGLALDNQSQTDSVEGDLQFYAEQARHNGTFLCSDDYHPQWLSTNRLVLENKNPNNWDEVYTQDGIFGVLTWAGDGSTFNFSSTFKAEGLDPNTNYSLIYAPDPWPQGIGTSQSDGTGTDNTVLGTGTSDVNGDLTITGNPNLGYDLPHPYDANYPVGAKIWLVLSSDHSGTQMTGWNPTEYLFETEFILYDDTDAPPVL